MRKLDKVKVNAKKLFIYPRKLKLIEEVEQF